MVAINSVISGLWSSPATWSGGVVPVLGDKVTINIGHIVTINGIFSAGDDTTTAIQVNGTLKASRLISSSLTCRGNLKILNGGTLDYGTSISIIPMNITAIILLNDSVTLGVGKYGLILNNGSKCYIYGATSTTNTFSTVQSLSGTSSITLNNITGWKVGDKFCIGGTAAGSTYQSEVKIISSIIGNVINFMTPFIYIHEAGARVSIITKNIVFKPVNTAYASHFQLNSNYLNSSGDREIQHFEMDYCGNNSSWTQYGALSFNGPGSPSGLYTSIGNLSVFEFQNIGIDVYNFQPIGITIDDSIIYRTTISKTGMYIRQGSILNQNRNVFMNIGTGITSAWSHGGVNCSLTDCWFVNVGSVFNNSSGQGFKFNNCKFASCYLCAGFYWGAAPYFTNCYFGYKSGLYDGRCQVTFRAGANANITPYFLDCSYNTSVVYDSLTIASSGFKLYMSNKNLDPLQQEIYSSTGNLFRDNTLFKTGISSLRYEPLSATLPVSNSWQIFAPTGALVVVSGYLRKNALYGTINLPKVTLSGLGITPSIFTMTDINDTWVQFTVSGTQVSGTDGILDLLIEGQSGNVGAKMWVDGIVAPAAKPVNSGDFGYWAVGAPAKLVAANFTSSNDVWNKLEIDVTLPGSMGDKVKRIYNEAKNSRILGQVNLTK